MKTLFDLIKAQADVRPDALAIVAETQSLTFSSLIDRAEKTAAYWHARGIKSGDRVLLLVPLSPALFVHFLAIMRLGAVVVVVDPAQSLSMIRKAVEAVRPDAFIGVIKAHFLRLWPEFRAIPKAFVAREGQSGPFAMHDGPSPDDAALISFTSGSTGRPKTIVRTHRFLLLAHERVREVLRPVAGERELSTLPSFIVSNLAEGVTSILPLKGYARPHTMDAAKMVAFAKGHRVNRLLAAPAFLQKWLSISGALDGINCVFTGGGPVFPNLMQRFQSLAPHARLCMVYGSSEAEPIAHNDLSDISMDDFAAMSKGAGLLAGTPDPHVLVRLKEAKNGIGEICVAGDHVVKSYADSADNAGTKFNEDGKIWHRTGDAGYWDDKGRLWLMGRTSAKQKIGSQTLWPFALEAAAMSDPHITGAGLVVIDGQAILAVTVNGDVDLEVLKRRLGLDAVLRLKNLPLDRRHHSKVLYPELRQIVTKHTRKGKGG